MPSQVYSSRCAQTELTHRSDRPCFHAPGSSRSRPFSISARSRYSFHISQEVSAMSMHPWQAAPCSQRSSMLRPGMWSAQTGSLEHSAAARRRTGMPSPRLPPPRAGPGPRRRPPPRPDGNHPNEPRPPGYRGPRPPGSSVPWTRGRALSSRPCGPPSSRRRAPRSPRPRPRRPRPRRHAARPAPREEREIR